MRGKLGIDLSITHDLIHRFYEIFFIIIDFEFYHLLDLAIGRTDYLI